MNHSREPDFPVTNGEVSATVEKVTGLLCVRLVGA